MEKEVILRVEELTKVFGSKKSSVVAVDNVSFVIEKGKIVSLVGQSGSGKTTIARMLLRLIRPTSGCIFYKNRQIFKLKEKETIDYWKHIQGIFQDPFSSFNQFYKVSRVLNNTFKLFKNPPGGKEQRKMIESAVQTVGLNPDEILNKYPYELSGGQRQRIIIARILLINPKVLIADEPTSMIDASSRVGILNLFLSLRDRYKMSIIFITHDMGLAYYASDILLIMNKGKIVERGEAEKVITNPKNPYTQRLLSDVPLIHKKWEF